MNAKTKAAVTAHGQNLLAVFPGAVERDPVELCRKLQRLERDGEALALRLCNGPEISEADADAETARILGKVNALLGNAREYQPKTGAACGCRRGVQRDNCAACEGTGRVIDFRAIRNAPPLVPVFLNRDPRGYALKIDEEWLQAARRDGRTVGAVGCCIYQDWGGYGIIAPNLTETK
jgi:hypothetical protein